MNLLFFISLFLLSEYDAKDLYGPEITDKDGALLDAHDSFYITTKSLLVLFQIMGVMPIMRVPKSKCFFLYALSSALNRQTSVAIRMHS